MLRTEVANFFNDILQVDIFFLWNKAWILIVDEATRYKVCGEIHDMSDCGSTFSDHHACLPALSLSASASPAVKRAQTPKVVM